MRGLTSCLPGSPIRSESLKKADPHNNINHGISNQTFRMFKRQYTAMMFNFFKMNLFKPALMPELRAVVAKQDPEAMMVKKMYMCATTAQ